MAQAERCLSKLEHVAEEHSLAPFRAVALALRGQYLIRIDRMEQGMHHLQDALEKLKALHYEMYVNHSVFELVVCVAKRRTRAEALALADQWLAAKVKTSQPGWLTLLFLAKGLAYNHGGAPDFRSAEEYLEKAIAQALNTPVRITGGARTRSRLDRARRVTESP